MDRYFKNSLKQNIQSSRGLGSRKHSNDETKIPGDFRSNFLTNSDNKNDLHVYLAEQFVGTPIFQKHLVVTCNDSILTNNENIIAEDKISNCDIEEADQRIIRHLINCAKNGFKKLFVSTGDTDVLILLMSVLPNFLGNIQCELICQFGIGDNLRYYKVNDLCSSLANDVCIIALLFFFILLRGVTQRQVFTITVNSSFLMFG